MKILKHNMRTLALAIMALTLSVSPVLAQRQLLNDYELKVVELTARLLCDTSETKKEFEENYKNPSNYFVAVYTQYRETLIDSTNNNESLMAEADKSMVKQIIECLDAKESNR